MGYTKMTEPKNIETSLNPLQEDLAPGLPEDLESDTDPDEQESSAESLAIIDSVNDISSTKNLESETFEIETDPKGQKVFMGTDGIKHPETPRAKIAFDDYLKLGPNRSLQKLATLYADGKHDLWSFSTSKQYLFRALGQMSTDLDWQNRIKSVETTQTALVIAHARKTAARRKRIRIQYFQTLMRAGARIIEKSGLLNAKNEVEMSQKEARELLKEAIHLVNIGAQGEKLEIGEGLEKIAPTKPLNDYTDDELNEYMELLRTEMQ